MRRLALIVGFLALAQTAYAGGPKWRYEDPKLNDEISNIYHGIRNVETGTDDPLTLQGLTVSSITVLSSATIYGTRTNDSPPAGAVGEYVESKITSATSFPTTGNYGDATSLVLTAGDWDVSATAYATAAGATVTQWDIGISATSGNSSAGLTPGDNQTATAGPTASADGSLSLTPFRVSINLTTTYYLKIRANYSVATPKYYCRLSARRVR